MILFVAKRVGRVKLNKQEESVTGKGIVLIVNASAARPTGIDIRNGTQLECVNSTPVSMNVM
jgi:hypothetical protein